MKLRIGAVSAIVLSLALALTSIPISPVQASVSGWNAGNIMSDSVMGDHNSMSKSAIQSFLKSKNKCNNSDLSWLTSHTATLGKYRSTLNGKPYTFTYTLKNGKFVCMHADKFNGESAAQIIYKAAKDYKINPQVLLVLLEKEQSLITDTFPNNIQYRGATGFGCPDTAECDTKHYGLKNQVRKAAALFREVLSGGWSNYPVGRNYIQYNPDPSCGGSTVDIKNRATSALYRYTPYQPNKAALAAGLGSAPCGAYGNRNTYILFKNWFGDPRDITFKALEAPRYMQAKSNLSKTSLRSLTQDGTPIKQGQVIYFNSKTTIEGVTYLRTRHDTTKGVDYGIPFDSLEAVQMSFTPMKTPRYMKASERFSKINPITEANAGITVRNGQDVLMVDKVTIGKTTYLRSQHDSSNNLRYGMPIDSMEEIKTTDMSTPRLMIPSTDAQKLSFYDLSNTGETIAKDNLTLFKKKRVIQGKTYLQSNDAVEDGTPHGVSYDDLEDIPITFKRMKTPRYMRLSESMRKTDIRSGEERGELLEKGRDVYFVESFTLNGIQYLRTELDAENGSNRGIPFDKLEALQPEAMINPRVMVLKRDTHKRSFHNLSASGALVKKGRSVSFSSKLTINGTVYLRTTLDTDAQMHRGIRYSDLARP